MLSTRERPTKPELLLTVSIHSYTLNKNTYSLREFRDKTHKVPRVANGFAVVGEDKVVPNHEEKGMELVKIGFLHEWDFAHGCACEVMICLAVKRAERAREVDEGTNGQNHKEQREAARRQFLDRGRVNAVDQQVEEGTRGVEIMSEAAVSHLRDSEKRARTAKGHSVAPLRTMPGLQHAEGARRGCAGGS